MVNAGDKLVEFNLDDLEQQNQKAELTVKANSLGYQDSVNKSAQAAQTQADAKSKAATLQQQVDAKKQEVANLTAAIAGDAQAQAAALQQANDSVNNQIVALQQQQEDTTALVAQAQAAYSTAQVAQQNAQVNFDAATVSGNAADVASASETLKAANAALSTAKNDYDTNKAQLDNITAQITALQSDNSVGTGANENTQLQQKLTTAQSELADLQSQLESQKAIAEADSATLSKEAKAQMQTNNNLAELEQKSLAELIQEGKNGISAEFNGVISDNQVVEGATVSQGMQLFTLQSIDDVNVNVSLSKNVYEKVKEGQKIAIVGPTGAGKTTMIKLLMRFYDGNDGSIKIDGHDIRDFNRSELREMFGMVLQDTWLFHGSIRENIRYGKLDATDEEVIQAAKAAHVHRFVKTLPGGYDMELNEEASNVSQGQKQLLTIARAILADPKILILDEATSSVDTRTEVLIQKAMDNLMKGRTSFVIAHRLSTIRDADLILVMKDGDIVEQGNHEGLLAKGGFYADLYNSQFENAGECA